MILSMRPHAYRPIEYLVNVTSFQDFYNMLLINRYIVDSFDSQVLCKYLYSELLEGNLITEIGNIKCEMHNFKDKKLEELYE